MLFPEKFLVRLFVKNEILYATLPWHIHMHAVMYTETGKQFGEGAFGKVVEVVDAHGTRFAKKICTRDKYMCNTDQEKMFMELLQAGNRQHRGYNHVVQLEAVERNSKNTGWDLIMCCYEGNLLDLMESQHTEDAVGAIILNALPEAVVKDIALHTSLGLAYIGTLGYSHCDIKPENILWKTSKDTPSGYHFSVADFGNVAKKMDHFYHIQTRQYTCTENLLGVESIVECDMPSLACVLYEAIVGDFLTNHRQSTAHISAHMEAIGKDALDVFDPRESPAIHPHLRCVMSHIGHLSNPYYPLQKAMVKAGYIAKRDMTDLIKYMLIPYPKQRIKAKDVCTHAVFESDRWFMMDDPMVMLDPIQVQADAPVQVQADAPVQVQVDAPVQVQIQG